MSPHLPCFPGRVHNQYLLHIMQLGIREDPVHARVFPVSFN